MQLLAGTLYDPSSSVAKATSSRIAMTALDTTNLRLAFTTPVNCTAVLVRMRCNLSGATTMPQILLGVLDGATVKGRQVPQGSLPGTAIATTNVSLVAEFLITGLTGNTAYTYDAAYGVETEVASTNIHYGGPNNTTANDAWGGFAFEIWDPAPAPSNFDVFSVDSNGRVDVIKVAGTTQTARDVGASVLLSSGTGTGQLDFTSGVVKANLAQILGTALTETAGQIAAAFKQFFDVASPTGTMKAITNVVTATNLTNLPAITSNWLTAAGIASGALNGKGDWNIGKTGYALSSAGIQAIWDALTSALTTASSIGKLLVDNINATISSRSSHSAADVWAVGTRTLTSFGTLVQDIWDKATSALTVAGSIGKLLVDNVNATISSRASQTSVDNVQSDTDNIQTRIPAALSGDGFMKADLKSIEDELTSGNNATLNLKQLNIQNPDGDALVAKAIGPTNGNGFDIEGFGSGHGVKILSGVNQNGIYVESTGDADTVFLSAGQGKAINLESFSSVATLNIENFSTGKSINAPNDISVSDGDLTLAAIAAAVWANATRTLTSISDSAGITTLLSRIGSALNISGGKVEANVKQINDTTLTGDGSSGNPWGPA